MHKVFTFTQAGGGHDANEDAIVVQSHGEDSNCCICALADGQGGRAGGREAAQAACRIAMDTAIAYSPQQLADPLSWPTILRTADDAVCNAPEAGFTTLIAACITGATVCGASSGDSAAIVLNDRSDDQHLTARQIKNPPVGSGMAQFVPFVSRLKAPWLVMLVSDGVWKYAGWERIVSIIKQRDGQAIIESLQDAARLPNSGKFQDDFSVVVIQDIAEELF